MRLSASFAILLAISGTFANNVQAEDHYYMVVFGCQNSSNTPKYSHTWATFAKVTQTEAASKAQAESSKRPIETFTISWLPATMNVVALRLVPEVGRNYSLDETIKWANSVDSPVVAYGPVEIKKSTFVLARQQYDLLNKGAFSYRALDSGRRDTNAVNCMHAVSDIVPGPRLVTGISRGQGGSSLVFDHFRPYFTAPASDPDTVAHLMGIDRYGLTFRHVEAPVPAKRTGEPIATQVVGP